jgi:hypothetical protein
VHEAKQEWEAAQRALGSGILLGLEAKNLVDGEVGEDLALGKSSTPVFEAVPRRARGFERWRGCSYARP